jgi:lipoprotein-anchoring transpeptidase ErfK/SrfK
VQTLKTAVVVILLLVVFYGVYEMLNRPPDEPPHEVAQMDEFSFAPPDIQFGGSTDARSPTPPPAPPRVDFGDTHVVTVPSANSNRSWPELPESGENPLPEPGLGLPLELTVPTSPEPPRATSAPPLMAPSTPATRPETEPADPRLQRNPFMHEDVVVRPPSSAGGAPVEQLGVQAFERAWKQAQSQIKDQQFHEALATLSAFYKSPDLTPHEHQQLLDVLDPLAGRVIYSREHLCEPAYTVRRNERLSEIAQRYSVPPQVLQKINGINNPDVLVPGMELKVVTGPFRADVDVEAQELTVFLGRLYAGRFPIALGSDFRPTEGEFVVRDKRQDRVYYGIDGRQIPAGNPANPFGQVWLDLGREISIHGSATADGPQQRGCISLSPQDADDVYGILSIGSAVRILR